MTRAPRDWWRRHFDDAYWRLHEPLFSEEASRREVGAMIELLGLPWGARVLDAPCGWMRHAVHFAEAGFRIVGADLSPELLLRAPEPAPPRVAADIRALPFPDGSFDAVLNVFTSLGLFQDDAEDVRALAEARRVLVSGGALLLESMHRDDVVANYAERDRWRLPDGTELRARRRFDPVSGISHEVVRWRRGEEKGERRHALRLRTATELDGLLRAAGFDRLDWYGDWDGGPFHHRAERAIVVARTGAGSLATAARRA